MSILLLSLPICRTVKCPDLVYQPNEWRQQALEYLRGLAMKHPMVWNKFKRRPLYEFLEHTKLKSTRAHTRLFLGFGLRHKTEVGVRVVMVWRQREGAYAWPLITLETVLHTPGWLEDFLDVLIVWVHDSIKIFGPRCGPLNC